MSVAWPAGVLRSALTRPCMRRIGSPARANRGLTAAGLAAFAVGGSLFGSADGVVRGDGA